MVFVIDHKAISSFVRLPAVMTHSLLSTCVQFLPVIVVTCGSLLLYVEVNMETNRHATGSQFDVIFTQDSFLVVPRVTCVEKP
jgi:hypothetical protein